MANAKEAGMPVKDSKKKFSLKGAAVTITTVVDLNQLAATRDTSCCSCTILHPVRRLTIVIVDNKWFERVILALIMANCICLAINSPLLPDGSPTKQFLDISGIVFTSLFTVEACLKMIRVGIVCRSALFFCCLP